jgi:DNA-(apurinic or apyrimidinic site) lyase
LLKLSGLIMQRRVTRSAVRAAPPAALVAESSTPIKQAVNHDKVIRETKRKRPSSTGTSKVSDSPPQPEMTTVIEAQSLNSSNGAVKQEDPGFLSELPHNLGSVSTPLPTETKPVASMAGSDKENRSLKENTIELATNLQNTADKATTKVETETKLQTIPGRKPKKNTYGLTPGVSPFPELTRPTSEECEEVNRLLSSIHGEVVAPTTIPEPSLTVTGCGEVPSVLDALIRTLLSGATTGKNSARAFNGLVQRFGILSEGIGKGSVNWEAVRQATVKDVFEAIKSGGLADIKSKNLKAILDIVHEDNQARRNVFLDAESKDHTVPKLVPDKAEKDKEYEIACADQNFLSLNHLHNLSTEEAMTNLIKYPGIGPKTAACVVLFCLQRPCFAVDTHIFRLCRWLGWVPAKANEVTAFSHLEVRIPDHLKYSLHSLFIRHGKSCPRCRAITGESSDGWEDGCVIDHLVTRTGKRKGNGPAPISKPKKTTVKKNGAKSPLKRPLKRKRKDSDSEEATEESELSSADEMSDGYTP